MNGKRRHTRMRNRKNNGRRKAAMPIMPAMSAISAVRARQPLPALRLAGLFLSTASGLALAAGIFLYTTDVAAGKSGGPAEIKLQIPQQFKEKDSTAMSFAAGDPSIGERWPLEMTEAAITLGDLNYYYYGLLRAYSGGNNKRYFDMCRKGKVVHFSSIKEVGLDKAYKIPVIYVEKDSDYYPQYKINNIVGPGFSALYVCARNADYWNGIKIGDTGGCGSKKYFFEPRVINYNGKSVPVVVVCERKYSTNKRCKVSPSLGGNIDAAKNEYIKKVLDEMKRDGRWNPPGNLRDCPIESKPASQSNAGPDYTMQNNDQQKQIADNQDKEASSQSGKKKASPKQNKIQGKGASAHEAKKPVASPGASTGRHGGNTVRIVPSKTKDGSVIKGYKLAKILLGSCEGNKKRALESEGFAGLDRARRPRITGEKEKVCIVLKKKGNENLYCRNWTYIAGDTVLQVVPEKDGKFHACPPPDYQFIMQGRNLQEFEEIMKEYSCKMQVDQPWTQNNNEQGLYSVPAGKQECVRKALAELYKLRKKEKETPTYSVKRKKFISISSIRIVLLYKNSKKSVKNCRPVLKLSGGAKILSWSARDNELTVDTGRSNATEGEFRFEGKGWLIPNNGVTITFEQSECQLANPNLKLDLRHLTGEKSIYLRDMKKRIYVFHATNMLKNILDYPFLTVPFHDAIRNAVTSVRKKKAVCKRKRDCKIHASIWDNDNDWKKFPEKDYLKNAAKFKIRIEALSRTSDATKPYAISLDGETNTPDIIIIADSSSKDTNKKPCASSSLIDEEWRQGHPNIPIIVLRAYLEERMRNYDGERKVFRGYWSVSRFHQCEAPNAKVKTRIIVVRPSTEEEDYSSIRKFLDTKFKEMLSGRHMAQSGENEK